MNFLDQLAFGPERHPRAWLKSGIFAIVVLTLAGILLYLLIFNDYSFMRATIYTGTQQGRYFAVGSRLEDLARAKGGRLNAVETVGAMDNITRLTATNGSCVPSFALVQDGLPVSAQAGIVTLGRLPQPESLLLLTRRGRTIQSFNDLRRASVGIGPLGSGTEYLMRQLLEQQDLKALELRAENFNYESQAELLASGELDFAAMVMNENADLVRTLVNKYSLDVVSPIDIEGLVARERWLRLGKIPVGFYDVTQPSPAADRVVAQVDTLVMANSCVHRAERIALLVLLSEEFPSFIRSNPPPAAKSQDEAPLAEEARAFFAAGGPELADRYFPSLVNLMSPAYWIYLFMATTIVIKTTDTYSRFRLWRIDANRERLESQLKVFEHRYGSGASEESQSVDKVRIDAGERRNLENLFDEFERLQSRCRAQLRSLVTPMGSEMYYRYQEILIEAAKSRLTKLLQLT